MYCVSFCGNTVKSNQILILFLGFLGVMSPSTRRRKQPKNPFYFFMVHFRSQEEAKGVTFPGGMKNVAEKAAPIWKVSKCWDYKAKLKD
jgi:hypothetical protein